MPRSLAGRSDPVRGWLLRLEDAKKSIWPKFCDFYFDTKCMPTSQPNGSADTLQPPGATLVGAGIQFRRSALCYCASDGKPFPQLLLQSTVYITRSRCAFLLKGVLIFCRHR
jgi:hypothetical protein